MATFGLRNQRGSCWVNATLQAIYRLPEVQQRYTDEKADENNPIDLCLQEIWASKGDEGLKALYESVNTDLMPAGEGIGDSHELLEFFCDKLPFLDKLCRFKMSHQVKCTHCDYSDLRTDSLIEFSVTPTAKKQGLITTIGHAVQPVAISDWTCEKCKEKGCTKQLLMSTFPDVPTIVEAGFPGATAINWFVLAGPAGMPDAVVARIREAFTTAINEPGMKERIAGLGVLTMTDNGPADVQAFVSREAERWAPVVRASGATPG